jgi:hypothetical protein
VNTKLTHQEAAFLRTVQLHTERPKQELGSETEVQHTKLMVCTGNLFTPFGLELLPAGREALAAYDRETRRLFTAAKAHSIVSPTGQLVLANLAAHLGLGEPSNGGPSEFVAVRRESLSEIVEAACACAMELPSCAIKHALQEAINDCQSVLEARLPPPPPERP